MFTLLRPWGSFQTEREAILVWDMGRSLCFIGSVPFPNRAIKYCSITITGEAANN